MDEQRREFAQRRFLAMPLAGAVAWTVVGVAGIFLRPGPEVLVLFAATGSILYLGMFFSRFTGENFLDKERPKNVFDGLFFSHHRDVSPGLCYRHSLLPRGLYVVAFVSRHPEWFDVAAAVLDHRTLDRHVPHLGAHRPRDGELVSIPGISLCRRAGSDCGHLRCDYSCPRVTLAAHSPCLTGRWSQPRAAVLSSFR